MNRHFLKTSAAFAVVLAAPIFAQTAAPPPIPANLQPPPGHSAYLRAQATGTQNYVCLPGAAGLGWKFQGPQATLFVTFRWMNGEIRQQVMTHYLSPNPMEAGAPARPAWQSSHDTSVVWGKKIAESSDPRFVAPGSIPWLLLEAAGAQHGPTGGGMLSGTTYIQRVLTAGGGMPAGGCSEAGTIQFVPYTTDYIFYRASGSN
jgi:hypothetical protein